MNASCVNNLECNQKRARIFKFYTRNNKWVVYSGRATFQIGGTVSDHDHILVTKFGFEKLNGLALATRLRGEFGFVEAGVLAQAIELNRIGVHVCACDIECVGHRVYDNTESARDQVDRDVFFVQDIY